jgi:multidrug efflux system outer membrane protein
MKTLIVCSLLALTGCAVGPNYKRPQLALPDQFRGATTPAAGAASYADTKWQELFPDPALNQMVTNALAHNFDLQIAAERIEQARAQLGITRANQFPFLDAQAGLTGSRSSSVGSSTFVRAGTNLSATFTTVGAALSWELDVFGRLRRLSEAARANYLSSQEGRHAVTVSLVAGVMDTWFQLLEQDSVLEISK